MNHVSLLGRICNDIELKSTQNSVYARFRVAVNRYSKGEKTADFIRLVAWGKNAENIARYFHKGDMIAIDGNLHTSDYTDRNGMKQFSMEVVIEKFHFTGSKSQTNAPRQGAYSGQNPYPQNPYPQNGYAPQNSGTPYYASPHPNSPTPSYDDIDLVY